MKEEEESKYYETSNSKGSDESCDKETEGNDDPNHISEKDRKMLLSAFGGKKSSKFCSGAKNNNA